MKAKRDYIITEQKIEKPKFKIFQSWKSYGQMIISVDGCPSEEFDTYIEAEKYMYEKLKKYSSHYVIVQIYNMASSKKGIINKDSATINQYAVFRDNISTDNPYLKYVGVIEGFDRQDAMKKIQHQFVGVKIFKLNKDGLLTNQTWNKIRYENIIESSFEKETGWDKITLSEDAVKKDIKFINIIPK